MGHSLNEGYQKGGSWVECPRCGFDKRKSELVWDPILKIKVCKECQDEKEPPMITKDARFVV